LFVIDGDRAKERVVTVGDVYDGAIEVLTGLSVGERVITSAVNQLTDGVRVLAR
jgi:multidrug efflux pump subunit AcrA (membrane-fusion protein)